MIYLFAILAVYGVLRRTGRESLDCACLALAAGLALSSADHLLNGQWYVSVMASWLPHRPLLVWVSAGLRLILAAALLTPSLRLSALSGALLLMLIVLQVNLRVALWGAQIWAAAELAPWWRWTRLALHLGWLAWVGGCLAGTVTAAQATATGRSSSTTW